MKIALYGGSFNPPHLGHRRLVEIILEQMAPDKVLVIPDRIPPHKELPKSSPSPESRLEMCRLAFDDLPNVDIDDLEIHREGPSYTADTVNAMHERYPDASLALLIGSDMLLTFHQWKRIDEIFRVCELAVVSREKDDRAELEAAAEMLRRQYGAKITIYNGEPIIISSTRIRAGLADGSAKAYLSEAVSHYIEDNGFYM